MSSPVVAAGAVVRDEHERLLVVQRRHEPAAGRWTLPGGRVDLGETLADAVRREVREETGLDVEVGDLVGVTEVRTTTHHYVILDFHAVITGGDLMAGDDAVAVAWMGRAQLLAAGTTDGLLDFLDAHGVVVP